MTALQHASTSREPPSTPGQGESRTGRRYKQGGLAVLLGISVIMIVSIAVMIIALDRRQKETSEAVRPSALWAFSRLDRERAKLDYAIQAGLYAPVKPSADDIARRFDLLYASNKVLQNSTFFENEPDRDRVQRHSTEVNDQIAEMARRFDQIGPSTDLDAFLGDLQPLLVQLKDVVDEILPIVQVLEAEKKANERDATSRIHLLLGMALLGMTLSMAAVTALLVKQVRRIARSQDDLAFAERENTQKTLALQEKDRTEAQLRREAELKQSVDAFNEHLNASVSRLTTMIETITAMCESMTEAASEARDGSDRAAHSSLRASDHVAGVARSAEEISIAGRDIASTTLQTSRIFADVGSDADRTAAAIHELRAATEQIDSISRLIEQVAGHTNLLALNATIEAARAGEAGRGFAVVASEIKSLSSQTRTATSDIAEQIQAIHSASALCMTTLDDIRQRILGMSRVREQVTAILDQQSASVSQVASMIRATAGESAAASSTATSVKAAIGHVSGQASETLRVARMMNDEAQQIRAEIEAFRRSVA